MLLSNVKRLEDLLRSSSKEQNPKPNYDRLLCAENKVQKFQRLKNGVIEDKGNKQIEREIISTPVE